MKTILVVGMMVMFPAIAFSDLNRERDALIHQFDELIMPQVEKSLANPMDNDKGGIAWGVSYQLAALAEILDVTRNPRYADAFVKLGRRVADARDYRHARVDEIRNLALPAWSSIRYSNGKRYVWAVHTGMIVEPMAHFAAVVYNDKTLSGYTKAADYFLEVAKKAVAVHDNQYREGPNPDEGYLYGLWLKKPLPLNQQNALARAWIWIDEAEKNTSNRPRIERLARFFKNRLRTVDGAYEWAYWPPLEGPGDGCEDISHAAINVDFITLCAERSIVFNDEDLSPLGKTLLQKVIQSNQAVSNNVCGGGGQNKHMPQVFRWGRLARHKEAIRTRLLELSESEVFRKQISPLGIAYLVLPERSVSNHTPLR